MEEGIYTSIESHRKARGEYSEKRSRFITFLSHIESPEEAAECLRRTRIEHPSARHVVQAFRILGNQGKVIEHASDDAEPSGTAGAPTLEILQSNNLVQSCLCSVRYFGGILLGPGGLKRAYRQSAKNALSNAQEQKIVCNYAKQFSATITLDFNLEQPFRHLLAHADGKVLSSTYTEQSHITFALPENHTASFLNAVKDKLSMAPVLSHESVRYIEEPLA